LIVTSDHGESLGDHGENAHSFFIYDSTLRVPLIFRHPGILQGGRKVTVQTRLIDLFPTVLDLLSIPSPAVSGSSLKPWLLDPTKPDPNFLSYCETYTPELHFGWSRLLGIRTREWKYIDAPRPELYQITNDPMESRNVITKNAAKAAELKRLLATSEARKPAPSNVPVDPETLEKLASLGYAGISAPAPRPGAPLADPKDKIADFKLFNLLIREGIEAFQKERFQEAASKFQQLRDRNIPSFEVHYYLGRSLLRLKSYDKSRTELELALQRLPHFLPAYKDLSEAWEGLGDSKKAEEALLGGLRVSPNHPILVQPLAWFYQRQKRHSAAEELLLAELKEHPKDLESRFRLGAIYRDTGRVEAAMAQFRQVLAARPDDAEAHNQLGMLYGGRNQYEEAAREFSEAVRLAPETEMYQKNLEMVKAKLPATTQMIRFRMIQSKTRAAAEVILRKLQSGEDWGTLARDYSIHPSARSGRPILEMASSEVDPLFLQALSKIQPGQLSPIIESRSGFFILRKE
jgi:tetratricopeptide (TPR) repeat protein